MRGLTVVVERINYMDNSLEEVKRLATADGASSVGIRPLISDLPRSPSLRRNGLLIPHMGALSLAGLRFWPQ